MLRWLGRLLGGGAGPTTTSGAASVVPPGSARVARDRLSLILQSNTRALNDFSMVDMHREIFQVIQRFLPVELDDVTISVKKDRGLDIFEMQILLPDNVQPRPRRTVPAGPRPVTPLAHGPEDGAGPSASQSEGSAGARPQAATPVPAAAASRES